MEIKLIFKKGTPNWLFLLVEKYLLGDTVFFGRNDRKSPVIFSLTLVGPKKNVGQKLAKLAKMMNFWEPTIEPKMIFNDLPNGAEFLLISEVSNPKIIKKCKLFNLPPSYRFKERSVDYNACTLHEKSELLSLSPETEVIWFG